MWKRILVPHDWSECAERALEVAGELALQSQGQLILLHVSPLPPNLPHEAKVSDRDGARVSVDELLTSGALRDLESLAAPLKARGLTVRTCARAAEPGSPAPSILRVAEELEADVIVLGTHGRTGLSHLLSGSVAETVIRGASIPVVTVRSREQEEPHLTSAEAAAEDELAG